jgi:ankyrin repeat protein
VAPNRSFFLSGVSSFEDFDRQIREKNMTGLGLGKFGAGLLILLTVLCSAGRADDGAALINAAKAGDLAQVKELLDKGADVDSRNHEGMTPLMVASINENVEIAILLLEHDADVDAKAGNGAPVLMIMATMGQSPLVQLFLDWAVDVDGTDNNGVTSLMAASYEGHMDVVKMLLDGGADVNIKSKDGDTALKAAIAKDRTDIAALLKEYGAKE